MSGKKLFESDISRSLTALGLYYYKPPDIMQAGQDKVDYFINVLGRFVALEAKQVPGGSCPPSEFSKGQKLCLRTVALKNGTALVAVNYRRMGIAGSRGTAYLYRVGYDDPFHFKDVDRNGIQLEPVPPGLWDLFPAMRSLIS